MASLSALSETEMRLFNQVCGAVNATNESQKNLLKSFICNEVSSEWTRLVSLAESNGPLSVLSEDELKYLNSLQSASRGHRSTQSRGGVDIFSEMPFSQKTIDHNMVKAALHDINQYNNVLEKLLVKYKDYVRRSIANLQRPPETNDEVSMVKQKISDLSRRKDLLRSKIRTLEDKISHHTNQLEETGQSKSTSIGTDTNERLKSVAPNQVFETTIVSYDHILGRLNALYYELGDDVIDEDAILRTARRHANQIVLSLATKCRASLDTVFLETSYIHNKRVSFAPSNAQAVNDERDDVYAEIRSLWDEMVPLAHMVVEKEFLKPILGKVETCSERQTIRDATVSRYTSAILSFMNERLRLLADRIKMLAYHHQSLLGTFTHINTQELDITKRLAKNPPSGQKKGGGKVKDHTLLENIRRQMELYGPVPINVDKANALTPHMQIRKLDHYVTSRQKKGDDLSKNIHQFFEKAAKAELTDAELRSQLLLDSIVADSAAAGSQVGGHVYEDQQVEDSVATLKSQAEEIQTIFRQLRQDAADPPISAPEFIAYAHSQAAKQFSYKGGEGISLAKDQEQCPKFSALIHDWGDSVNFTN